MGVFRWVQPSVACRVQSTQGSASQAPPPPMEEDRRSEEMMSSDEDDFGLVEESAKAEPEEECVAWVSPFPACCVGIGC